MTAVSVSGTGRAGFKRRVDRKCIFIISEVCSPQSTATPTGSPASLCTPPCLISSPLPLMVLRVSGTIQGAHCDLLGFVLIRSFLSLAHRTSSTTSPLTAVDTLFGALDVATEEVDKNTSCRMSSNENPFRYGRVFKDQYLLLFSTPLFRLSVLLRAGKSGSTASKPDCKYDLVGAKQF